MLSLIAAFGVTSFLLWLLRVYIYGGMTRVGSQRKETFEDFFPPSNKEMLDKKRKSYAERKAEYDTTKKGEEGPPKTFFEEAEEYIAKRKKEVENHKKAAGEWTGAGGRRVGFGGGVNNNKSAYK